MSTCRVAGYAGSAQLQSPLRARRDCNAAESLQFNLPRHPRSSLITTRRVLRKGTFLLAAGGYNCLVCWSTCGLYATCALPRLLRPWCGLWLPLGLGFSVSIGEAALPGRLLCVHRIASSARRRCCTWRGLRDLQATGDVLSPSPNLPFPALCSDHHHPVHHHLAAVTAGSATRRRRRRRQHRAQRSCAHVWGRQQRRSGGGAGPQPAV